MLLSDVDIKKMMKETKIVLLDPAGHSVIDLDTGEEAGEKGLEAHGYNLRALNVTSWRKGEIDLKAVRTYTLEPGEFAIVETYERIRLANDIGATVHSMVRKSLTGFAAVSTTVHPGWSHGSDEKPTQLFVPIANIGSSGLELEYKKPFCRILFHSLMTPAQRPAPPPEDIFRDFGIAKDQLIKRLEKQQQELEQQRSRPKRIIGWSLWVVPVLLSFLAIFLLQFFFPIVAAPFATLAASLLTAWLLFLRTKFNIF